MPDNKDVHIYIDDDTGYKYIFDGTNLVRLPDDSGSSSKSDNSKKDQNETQSDENNSFADEEENSKADDKE